MSSSSEHSISMEADQEEEAKNIATTLCANEKVAPVYDRLKAVMADKDKQENHTEADKPKIQRVPIILREQKKKFEKYYEPRWISIGPIHHGKPKLQLAENQYKVKLAAKFIEDSDLGTELLYDKIKKQISYLKKCFDEDVIKDYEKDDDALSWMLFFDGCAALQFIKSYNIREELKKIFKIKNDQIALAQQDLFLLENQIPFRVLKILIIESRKDNKALKDSITDFIRFNIMVPNRYRNKLNVNMEIDPEPAHLLELLLLTIIQPPEKDQTGCSGWISRTRRDPIIIKKQDQPHLSTISTPKAKFACSKSWFLWKNKTKSKKKRQQSFRNVQDLKSAGIDLRPSETCCLRDVTFSSFGFAGWLRLPALTVDDSTGPRFLNLIAYEMCPDNTETEYEVTSYISFLDSLIDYPSDVKELRSDHILYNLLGCDEEVAKLFNKIATDLVPSPCVYEKVVAQIQSHYRSKWRTWMAQVYHEHFSSPWTIVAFLAAALAIFMSGVQTWYTVYSPGQ